MINKMLRVVFTDLAELRAFAERMKEHDIPLKSGGWMIDIDLSKLVATSHWAIREALEHRTQWHGGGPWCGEGRGEGDQHGPMTAVDERYPSSGSWKCLEAGCGNTQPLNDSLFMPMREFIRVSVQRASPHVGVTTGRLSVKTPDLDLLPRSSMERVYSRPITDFNKAHTAYRHIKDGGLIEFLLPDVDYATIEQKLLLLQREAMQNQDGLIVTSERKFFAAMKHVLPTDVLRKPAMVDYARDQVDAALYAYEHLNKGKSLDLEVAEAEIAKLKQQLERKQEVIDKLSGRLEGAAEIPTDFAKTLDRAYRFFCGLNLQDHSVKDQREYLSVMRELKPVISNLKDRT